VPAAELLQLLFEEGAHRKDALRHALDLAEPLVVQPQKAEDLARDTGTVDRRVRVHGPDEDLDLAVDALFLFCRGADDREGAYPLTVETLSHYYC